MEQKNHGLSAAEILVLLDPQKSPAREVFKVALKEMVALKHLKIVKLHQRVLLGSRDIKVLEFGPTPTQAVLLSAYNSLRKAQKKPETPLTTVLQTALGQWGANYGKFKQQVVEGLVGQGLLKSEVRRVLFFSSKHLEPTDAGRRLASRLQQDLARAQNLPQILRDDPQQATALYLSLGSAVLLSGAMWPHLEEINQQLRQQMASGDDGVGTDTYLFDDDTNFGELDASMSEFDAGFDAADGGGSDGGSDGGGDGGGGGGGE